MVYFYNEYERLTAPVTLISFNGAHLQNKG